VTCRGCGGERLDTVFHMDPMPLAGAFAETCAEAQAAERFPLEWRWCRDCGLVNVWPDIPGEAIYSSYSYRASEVPALVRHHTEFARFLVSRFPDTRLHIEIGGNDGVLTRHLPWASINVDPSDAWVGPGFNQPFEKVAGKLPRADLITASNSMAHFAAIGDALAGVRSLLHRDGRFVMEVHDLGSTLASNQWDTVYHEHAVEWAADSLYSVGTRHGLQMTDLERLPLHGGLLRATFKPDIPYRARLQPIARDFSRLQAAYDNATAPELPDGSVAYGAAARATVYLDHTRPNVSAVIDGSQRRAGRYVPGSGLPILPPEDLGDPPAVLITAWNHAEDIKARHPEYSGRWAQTWT
jgi:hypothetical protein